LVAAAATGAALSAGFTAVVLPVSAISRQRAIDVGLVTQSLPGWAGDVAKATAIDAALTGAGAALVIALMRRFPRGWWLPASALAVGAGAALLFVGPVVFDPVFNRFTRLDGEARADVLELAGKAGVDVGEVYEVDASRRTTAANAYVTGLGRTKRVVVYDTLLRDFTRDERRLVVAHELGHVHHRDVPRGLLFLALVAPVGLFAAARTTDVLARRADGERSGPAELPALALALAIVATPVTAVSNQLSRRIEARADSFALGLTDAPEPFVGFERRITVQNVSDPDPPRWVQSFMGTHPTTIERIGIAKAWENGRRA
jgi:STE24 endopeptidase